MSSFIDCDHQWIKIRKIRKYSQNGKIRQKECEKQNKKWKKERPDLFMFSFYPEDVTGWLIKCANCEEQKEIWED